jgi:uncharacterized membrane protein YciS (DUF1049 family)
MHLILRMATCQHIVQYEPYLCQVSYELKTSSAIYYARPPCFGWLLVVLFFLAVRWAPAR